MIRGTILFKCTECGNRFKAPDIEYDATIYSLPQPCPKCGSKRTRPSGLKGMMQTVVYKKIWDSME